MNRLFIDKQGFIYYFKSNELEEISPNDIPFEINSPYFELQDGFSLRDYFKLFENYPSLMNFHPQIKTYLEASKKCPTSGCVFPHAPKAHISIEPVIQIRKKEGDLESDDVYDTNNNMDINYNIIAKNIEDNIECVYSITLSPLESLLDMPLITEKTVVLNTYTKNIDGKTIFTEERFSNLNFLKLSDFILEVFNEISFLGTPENKKDEIEKINKRIEDIKTGKEKTISSKEAKERALKVIEKINDKK